jgi:hypothetical protein
MSDSTSNILIADMGAKDVIVPGERYTVNYEWVLDATTLVPVGVRTYETHSGNTFKTTDP